MFGMPDYQLIMLLAIVCALVGYQAGKRIERRRQQKSLAAKPVQE